MRVTLRGVAIATLTLVALLSPALAEDGCGRFAWSLAPERALLAGADKTPVNAGTTLASIPRAAITLHLQPAASAKFEMPPERKARAENGFGGALYLPAPDKPGIYQITLSDEAWIDVVQSGRYARSVGSTGRGDCPGVRKSVRLELGAAPFVLQLSGVPAATIAVVFGPAN